MPVGGDQRCGAAQGLQHCGGAVGRLVVATLEEPRPRLPQVVRREVHAARVTGTQRLLGDVQLPQRLLRLGRVQLEVHDAELAAQPREVAAAGGLLQQHQRPARQGKGCCGAPSLGLDHAGVPVRRRAGPRGVQLLREVDGAAAQARGVGGVAALADLDRTGQVTGLAVAAAQGGEQLQPGEVARALCGEVLQQEDRAVEVTEGLAHP